MRLLRSLPVIAMLAATQLVAAAPVPSPAEVIGFGVGEDRKPWDYGQIQEYFRRLDAASDRISMRQIGSSALGEPLLMMAISSEENMKRLGHWRGISEQLARGRIDEATARKLAGEGKAIVWVDGGMDDQEFATAQMTPELAYRLVTDESPEMRRIRDEVIVLLVPVLNPDGVVNDVAWYRSTVGTPYETTRPPRLGQPYSGTDNNRDWYMVNQVETRAISKVLYSEWYPQIVYNHHQTGPTWARIAIPPYSDPVNPDIHPGITTAVNLVGTAMANRLAMKKMPGFVARAIYDMWWNGGMRLAPYYHNMVGILTETAHRTPTPRSYDVAELPETLDVRKGDIPRTDGTNIMYPYPWKGGESHIRDAINYMHEATWATLSLAARNREDFLFNIWSMAHDAITEGEKGKPSAYVIPADQWDRGEGTKLANTLRYSGVEVHRATAPFKANGRSFAAGSYVVYTSQAYRPHVVNLMEPQHYPDRRRYPDGPPEPPYDLSGWTLPMQMGVRVERIEGAFQASVEPVADLATPIPGTITRGVGFGYALTRQENASVEAVNLLLEDGEKVYLADDLRGSYVIERGPETPGHLAELAVDKGLSFVSLEKKPASLKPLHLPRVGIYKPYHSRMDDQGWTLWFLEQGRFETDALHDGDIRSGDLSKYDAIVFADIPADFMLAGNPAGTMPEAYIGGLGAEGSAALKRYVGGGGRIIAFDKSTQFFIEQFGLPVRNTVEGLSESEFFIPGSILGIDVATEHPLAQGMPAVADAFFSRSRAFQPIVLARKDEGGHEPIAMAPAPPVEVVARYVERDQLRSGWAKGQERLAGHAAMVKVGLGKGDVVLFAFRPQHRGQAHGTYKLIYNSIVTAATE